MRILLTGAKGQLAQDLRRSLSQHDVTALTRTELDVRDPVALQTCCEQLRPQWIINTAAFHRVDDCEDQIEMAFRVNAEGACHLARAAQRLGAVLVHFSTNYVFDGTKRCPYLETDSPRPLSIYGMSKLAGEWAVQQYSEKYFLVRTCGLYGLEGSSNRGLNFIERMLKLASEGKPIQVVDDQIVNPTSTRDLAEKLVLLLHTGQYGLYHMTNTGECSWYEFARELFRQAGLSANLTPIHSEQFGSRALRPVYSVLENCALRKAGLGDFPTWQQALKDYLTERMQPGRHAN